MKTNEFTIFDVLNNGSFIMAIVSAIMTVLTLGLFANVRLQLIEVNFDPFASLAITTLAWLISFAMNVLSTECLAIIERNFNAGKYDSKN